MIDVKEAVKRAMDYLEEMYDTTKFKDVLLEEVEMTEDNKYWNVTVGFTRRQTSTAEGPMASLVGPSDQFRREFKVFKIDTKNGIMRSMKIKKSD
jgi:hypothetical protein